MIRVVTIGALLSLLVLVLYLPSAHPPDRFLAQIRLEHQAMVQSWGEAPAARILDRALNLQDWAREATPVPMATSGPAVGAVNGAVAREIAFVNHRLFDSSYFRAIDTLVLLAAFRLSTMLQWLPWVAVFVAAALTDGAVARTLKSKEFRQHDPERFALFATLAVLSSCAVVVGLVMPVTIHPLTLPAAPAVVAVLIGRSVGHFHQRA